MTTEAEMFHDYLTGGWDEIMTFQEYKDRERGRHKTNPKPVCRWMSGNFDEKICCNVSSPARADACPVSLHPWMCRFYERRRG